MIVFAFCLLSGKGMPRLLLREYQRVGIEPLLRGKAADRGRTGADKRLFVEAVLWMARTGAPWGDLPPAFGPWNSVFRRFSHWADKCVWQTICTTLCEEADFEEVFLDSTIVSAHQHAAGASKKWRTRSWPFSWGLDYQDSWGRRSTGKSRPVPADRR